MPLERLDLQTATVEAPRLMGSQRRAARDQLAAPAGLVGLEILRAARAEMAQAEMRRAAADLVDRPRTETTERMALQGAGRAARRLLTAVPGVTETQALAMLRMVAITAAAAVAPQQCHQAGAVGRVAD